MRLKPAAPFWTQPFLWGFLLASYVPLLFLVRNSFLKDGEYTLGWYAQLLADPNLVEPTLRSLKIAALNAVFSTLLGLCASMALHRGSGRLASALKFFVGTSLALPELVMALSLLSWFFLLGIPLSLVTVLIAHITFSLAFVIFIVGARLTQLDPSLEEAGADLGASPGVVFRKVTLPQLSPALWLSFLICFLLSFDDFLITFFVSGVGSDTLPLRLYQMLKQGTSPKLSALAALLLLLPVVFAGVLGLRSYVRSIKAGDLG